ncbi:MAG: two-component regulator propeller domain-containing protein [Flavobacteriaceae bacterium]
MSKNVDLITQIQPSINGNHWFYCDGEGIKLMQATVTNKENKLNLNLLNTNLIDPIFDDGFIVDFHEHSKNTIFFISNKLELVEIKFNEALQVISKKRIEIAEDLYDLSKIDIKELNLLSDANNRLWIGGSDILINYDISTGAISHLSKNENYTLKNKEIKYLFIDKFNILWVGTDNDGLFKIDIENNTILSSNEFIKKKDQYDQAFHQWQIKAMCQDNNGMIWLGADGKGGIAQVEENELNQSISNLQQKPWTFNYLNEDKGLSEETFYNIRKLFNDSTGNIWVGSSAGLSKINTSTATYETTVFDNLNYGNSDGVAVFAIEEDYKGAIWAGYWGNGLVKLIYNKTTKTYKYSTFKHNDNDSSSLSNNFIRDITEDSDKNIWVGTIGGLNKLKYDKDGKIEFERFLRKPNTNNCLSNNHVLDVFQSKNGNIYVGTFGGGLNEITISENNEYTFQHYTTKDGLPSDVVYQIKEDSEGNLWMMHIREISKLNVSNGEITYFEKQDGLNAGEFRDNSMLQTFSGLIINGGTNGFSFFDPNKLSTNRSKPQLVITDFKLFNESVKILEEKRGTVILDKNINETDKIVLPYNLNSIEFAFSSLHFSNPNKNQYKYILEGFDEKWQYSKGNERRFASYTNVPPGDYIFKVNGSNSAGIWADVPKAIAVVINKPWYLTTLAILFFSSLALMLIYSFIKIRLNQVRLKSKLDIESAVHEKSKEMNQMKLQFFTNISHELRTPLTLIVGPLSQIMKGNVNPKDIPKLNSIMYKSSNRLLKLINQLLDFRKAESGNLNLIVQNDELVSFIKEVFTAFEDIAFEKNIKFLFLPPKKEIDAWFDTDKIEKILYNLLSNAFKFTPNGKGITVSLEKETIKNEAYAIIKVIDYGIGIAKEELESIFERFYQAKKEDNSIHEGSGLGLAYIKHLVEIHKGRITIESRLHKGTICTVSIPISKTAYSNDSIIELQPQKYDFEYTKTGVDVIKENQLTPLKPIKNNKEHTNETPLLLIVEDNQELQEYLVTFFNYDYRILTANNGKEGLELATKNTPNIIISDLMMPIMNGVDMCKRLKTNINTSHIPVIILTAKVGLENEKEGLETGADEFILKPFDIEVLKLRLDNILRTKQQWIQKFKTSSNSNSKSWKELSNKLDQKFIEGSIAIVKKNINNSAFSVEKFALEIGMSRSALFLKLKSITGQSTSEFIRTIRLKRAAKLIKSGQYSISEVVYMVGFSDPKYFRTCFRKHFGSAPSKYLSDFKMADK